MILPLIGLAVLALIMLVFVLEPILRARSDAVVLDAAALPRTESEPVDEVDPGDEHVTDSVPRSPSVPSAIEAQPAGDTP